ncbi:hypothetical protein ABK040_015715 [Willaertia magna]
MEESNKEVQDQLKEEETLKPLDLTLCTPLELKLIEWSKEGLNLFDEFLDVEKVEENLLQLSQPLHLNLFLNNCFKKIETLIDYIKNTKQNELLLPNDNVVQLLTNEDILSHVFSYLKFKDFLNISKVCKLWRNVCETKPLALCDFKITNWDNNYNNYQLYNKWIANRSEYILKLRLSSYFSKMSFPNVKEIKCVDFMLHKELISDENICPNLERISFESGLSLKYPGMYGLDKLKEIYLNSNIFTHDLISAEFEHKVRSDIFYDKIIPHVKTGQVDSVSIYFEHYFPRSFYEKLLVELFTTPLNDSLQNKDDDSDDKKVKTLCDTITYLDLRVSFDEKLSFHFPNLTTLITDPVTDLFNNSITFDPLKLKKYDGYISDHSDFIKNFKYVEQIIIPEICFFQKYDIFKNLKSLKVNSIYGTDLLKLKDTLEELYVTRVTKDKVKGIESLQNLKKLSISAQVATGLNLSKLSNLRILRIYGSSTKKEINLESHSLTHITFERIYTTISLKCNSLRKLTIENYMPIQQLTIHSKSLEKIITRDEIKIISIKGPCPLNDGSFLVNVEQIIDFECPFLNTLKSKHFDTLFLHSTFQKLFNYQIKRVEIHDRISLKNIIQLFLNPNITIEVFMFSSVSCTTAENNDNNNCNDCKVSSKIKRIILEGCDEKLLKVINDCFSKGNELEELIIKRCRFSKELAATLGHEDSNGSSSNSKKKKKASSSSEIESLYWKGLKVLELTNCKYLTTKLANQIFTNLVKFPSLQEFIFDYETSYKSDKNQTITIPSTLPSFGTNFLNIKLEKCGEYKLKKLKILKGVNDFKKFLKNLIGKKNVFELEELLFDKAYSFIGDEEVEALDEVLENMKSVRLVYSSANIYRKKLIQKYPEITFIKH